jgi:single-strand DNA-binding protein
MQFITITGALGRDAELKRTKTGDEVLSFPVGVSQGYGDNKTTNWYRCSMWGKRAVNLQQYLMKGVKVAVAGEMKTGEYEGKTQLNIDVATLDFMSRGEAAPARQPTAHDKAKQNGYQRDDYLEDEAPF